MKTSKLHEARENAGDQVAFVLIFCFRLVESMVQVSWTNHREKLNKTKQSRIIFDI